MHRDHVVHRALKEAVADWRHELRGRGAAGRLLATMQFIAALPRLCWRALISLEEPPFRDFGRDVRYALRSLSRSPGFTVFSVASLAAGLATTTAVCSLMIATFLTPLDVPHRDRLVNLNRTHSGGYVSRKIFSRAEYLALLRADAAFISLSASAPLRPTLAGFGTRGPVSAEAVNGDYFSTLGVGAGVGRVLQPSDDRPDAPPVVVLSDRIWRLQFAADPGIVGKTVTVSDTPFVVAGIAPSSFHGSDSRSDTAAWVPLSTIMGRNRSGVDREYEPWLVIRGLLRPGVSVDQASAVVGAIGHALNEAAPERQNTSPESAAVRSLRAQSWFVVPTSHVYTTEAGDAVGVPMAWLVMTIVGLVLLVACSNLANLALARGAGRQHELAVRLALGATRWRVMREQLVESACVVLLAIGPSMLAARLLMMWIVNNLLANLAASIHPTDLAPNIGTTMAIVASVGAVTSFAVAGLWPSWQLTRANVRGALASDTSSNAALPRWKGRTHLIGWQVVCSVVFVFVAVIIGEHVVPIHASDSGMRLDGLAVANLTYPRHLRDVVNERRTLDTLLQRMREQRGISSASLIGRLDFSGGAEGVWVKTPDRPSVKGAPTPLVAATPEVFDVLGIPTRRGRTFDARDTHDAPPVVILSETTARTLFDTTDALGRIVAFPDSRALDGSKPGTILATVVGVVGDIQPSGSLNATGHTMYVPYAQTPTDFVGSVGIILRAADPGQAIGAVRTHVRAIDPELGIVDASVVLARWEAPLAGAKTVGILASGLGGLALLLAMAGLYGVLSHMVLRRRREIGLRMALGADRWAVLQMVLRQGLRPVVGGVLVGLFIAMIVNRVMHAINYYMPGPPVDFLALAIVPIPFLLAALAACVLPARRAAGVDPNIALREL